MLPTFCWEEIFFVRVDFGFTGIFIPICLIYWQRLRVFRASMLTAFLKTGGGNDETIRRQVNLQELIC